MAWITVHQTTYDPPRPIRVNTSRIAYYEAFGTTSSTQIILEAGLTISCKETPTQVELMIASAEAYSPPGPAE
jgi:hypothetical protein